MESGEEGWQERALVDSWCELGSGDPAVFKLRHENAALFFGSSRPAFGVRRGQMEGSRELRTAFGA